jgi:hypothetical protein
MTVVVGIILAIGVVALIGGGLAAAFVVDRKRSIAVETEPERFPEGSRGKRNAREWRRDHDV